MRQKGHQLALAVSTGLRENREALSVESSTPVRSHPGPCMACSGGLDTAALRSESRSIRGSTNRPDGLHPWPIGREARADRGVHGPTSAAVERSTNSASRLPLGRFSSSASPGRSYRETPSFGGVYSEVVACPRERCYLPPDMAQIAPRGARRERAKPPPHVPPLPPACECGPIPCSHASVRPQRSVFGGAAGQQCLGSSVPATRLFPGLHAASVVLESAPSRAAVASVHAMSAASLHRVRKSQGGE